MKALGDGAFTCPACEAVVQLLDPAIGRGLSTASKHDKHHERSPEDAELRRLQRRDARNASILLMRDEGSTLQEISFEFHLTPERVRQIVHRAESTLSSEAYYG